MNELTINITQLLQSFILTHWMDHQKNKTVSDIIQRFDRAFMRDKKKMISTILYTSITSYE